MLYYDVCGENRVRAVSSGWDDAALANSGFNCVAKKVIGRNLLDFVSGSQTQNYINALLFSARRSGQPVSTTYRCDADTTARLMYMTVAPRENGALRVTHIDLPISVVPQDPIFYGRILRGQCAQCYALNLDDAWYRAGIGHDMFMAPQSTGLCPRCRALAVQAMSANARQKQVLRPQLA